MLTDDRLTTTDIIITIPILPRGKNDIYHSLKRFTQYLEIFGRIIGKHLKYWQMSLFQPWQWGDKNFRNIGSNTTAFHETLCLQDIFSIIFHQNRYQVTINTQIKVYHKWKWITLHCFIELYSMTTDYMYASCEEECQLYQVTSE